MQKSLDWQRMNNKGTMEHKNKLIPELRFPECVKDGEWKEKIVGDILQSESSTMALNKLELKQSGYKVYGADSVVGYVNFYQQEEKYISIVKDGSGVGRLNLCEGKTSILGTLSCLKSKNKEKYNLVWSYYLLNTIDFSSYVKGAGIPHIYYSDYKNEKVSVPKPKEQQKIADCLTSLDELITAHNDKLETLKNHKKGLLQNLFPDPSTSSGQKVPNYRFPEFVNDGEWEEDALGKICDVRDGTHDSPKYVLKGYALITSKNLLTTGEIDSENVNYITENDYQQINKRSKVNIDDILFGMIGTIGNPVIVKKDGFAIKNVALIKSIGMIDQKFLLQQLKSNYILKQFEKENAGGILKFIALGTIRNLNIVIPSISEQKKIEKCLSTIENLITAQTEKVEQLKIHKKGLMQGLFPKIEE